VNNHTARPQFVPRGIMNEGRRKDTVMKIHRLVLVCAAIMIPQLVNAKLPFTNDIFGRLEGTLDSVPRPDPESAPKYRELAKLLVKTCRTRN